MTKKQKKYEIHPLSKDPSARGFLSQNPHKILAEMLIKQEENTAEIKKTNDILKEFMGFSVKQWEQQQKFNEKLFDKLEKIEKGLEKL